MVMTGGGGSGNPFDSDSAKIMRELLSREPELHALDKMARLYAFMEPTEFWSMWVQLREQRAAQVVEAICSPSLKPEYVDFLRGRLFGLQELERDLKEVVRRAEAYRQMRQEEQKGAAPTEKLWGRPSDGDL